MEGERKLKLNLNQRLRLLPNLLPKVDGVVRIAARHQRQFARGIVDEGIGEVVSAEDVLGLAAGVGVAGVELVHVDFEQFAVRVADEIEEEEEGGVGVGGLHLRVGFEGSVCQFTF